MKPLRIFFIFLSTLLFSQRVENFSISTVSQDNGLSQGSNYFRYEDKHGFMWITGNDALNRYDGENVKVYNLNYFFKNCPTLQQGYGFAEDQNNLYVGSIRGLYVYNYKKDEFTLIEIFKNSKTKTAMPIGFYDGKIWCFNENYQLASYDVKTKNIKIEAQIPLKPIKSIHIYDNEDNVFYFRMPFIDNHQNICFIGKNEIYTYNILTKKIENISQKKFPDKNIEFSSSYYVRETDELFLGTIANGIFRTKNNFTWVENLYKESKFISSIAANEKYLVFISNIKSILINRTNKIPINLERIYASGTYSFDKTGRLWFCKDGFGEVIINFNGTLLKNSNDLNSSHFKFRKGVVNFAELADNEVIIQTQVMLNPNKNIYKYLKGNKEFARFYGDPLRKGIWLIDNYFDQEFSLYFMDQNYQIKKFITLKRTEIGLLQDLKPFENGFLLLSFSNGIYKLSLNSKKIEKITALPDKNPFYISKISKSRMVISYLSNNAVLAEVDDKGDVKPIKNVLPKVQSFYFAEDSKKQQFWAGTNEGVYLLDKNFEIIKKFDSNNGLAGTYIYGILLDDSGKIWCSHQRGLSSIDTKTYQIINFDKNDGIQHWDYNNRAFLKTTDGTLFFGGVNGFNYFKPPLQFNSYYKPEIYFDEILINNKRYISENGINSVEKLRLNADENNIRIRVFVKDLENAQQRNLYYRIKNGENIWRKIPKNTPFILSSLAPDSYEIEFGYNDKFSQNIVIQKKLNIFIDKKYYQTSWFWAILSGLFFGGIFAFYGRWRFLQQKNYYRQKLALENQRNKITADLHDDIGATLSSLQINSAIANKMIEKEKISDAQKILKKIEIQSQKLSENIGDIVWSLKPNKDALMTLSTRIRNSANEILGSTNISYRIKIDEEIDEEFHDFSERKNLVLITKEALNNIAKYSKAKEVNILFKKFENDFILEIKDNGIGFDNAAKQGNGLQNMKKRAEEIGGNFEIFSKGGTTIKICIPKIRDLS